MLVTLCDSRNLQCKNGLVPLHMVYVVSIGHRLCSFCCEKCADDYLHECSDGKDNFNKARKAGDVYILDSEEK